MRKMYVFNCKHERIKEGERGKRGEKKGKGEKNGGKTRDREV